MGDNKPEFEVKELNDDQLEDVAGGGGCSMCAGCSHSGCDGCGLSPVDESPSAI